MERQFYKYQNLLVGEWSFASDYAIKNLRTAYGLTEAELNNSFNLQIDTEKIMVFDFDPLKINKKEIENSLLPYTYQPLTFGEYQDFVNTYNTSLVGILGPDGIQIPDFVSGLTLAELVEGRMQQYDKRTNYLIENTFLYNSTVSIRLNAYDQKNYSELNSMAKEGTVVYPRAIFTSNKTIYNLATSVELFDFITQIRAHIDNLLSVGWTEKERIQTLTLTQLQTWTDSR